MIHTLPNSLRWFLPRPRAPLIVPLILAGSLLIGCTTASTPSVATPTGGAQETTTTAPATAASTAAPPTAAPAPKNAAPLALDAISGDRAMEHVRQLSVTIGSRPTGTDKERAAADYIEKQFRTFGYEVTRQPFEFPWFEDLSALTVGEGEKFEVGIVAHSKEATVSAELADAGDGNQLAENSLTGKIALAERGVRTFEQKTAEAAKAGAAGLIIFNNRPGNFGGSMQGSSTIPVLAISREDGLKLRERLKNGPLTAKLAAELKRSTIKSENVVARGGDKCAVVVGGHYDSVPQAPGASDNASGTAVTLETARVAQTSAAARGLCFVAFGAEELGLYGSRAYVHELSADDRNFMLGMVNLDMEGFGDRWRSTGDAKLVDLSLAAAKLAGIEAQSFTLPEGVGSDHQSFLQANIPAVFPAMVDDPLFHTPQDTADRISPANLQNAGRWAIAILAEMTK